MSQVEKRTNGSKKGQNDPIQRLKTTVNMMSFCFFFFWQKWHVNLYRENLSSERENDISYAIEKFWVGFLGLKNDKSFCMQQLICPEMTPRFCKSKIENFLNFFPEIRNGHFWVNFRILAFYGKFHKFSILWKFSQKLVILWKFHKFGIFM